MNIGITGQNGFIGGSVAQAVSKAGHQVLNLDKCTRSGTFKELDLRGCAADLDWVLHFAAKTSIEASFAGPFSTYSNNLGSTLLALNIAYHTRAAFLFMSSYVYGIPKYLPIDEKHPTNPVNPYMGSKLAGEEICLQLSKMMEIPLVILRGFNIYGNCKTPGRLISDVVDAVRNRAPIVVNDAVPKRDYLYIKDFNSLVSRIVSEKPPITGTYNVGYGHSYSNLEVAEMARRLSRDESPIVVNSRPRSKDILDCSVDVRLIKKTFSWSPMYPLEKGLRELIR